MLKGLVIHQGTALNNAWLDRMIIDNVPVSIRPTTLTVTINHPGTGTLPTGTYWYAVTAIGINGESIGSANISAAVTLGDTVTLNWDTQTYVGQYKIYRGNTVAGNFQGVTHAFTNTFVDDGTVSYDTTGVLTPVVYPNIPPTNTAYGAKIIAPPASNEISGTVTTLGGVTWHGKRSTIFFGQLTVKGYTFIPLVSNDTDTVPSVSKIHLNYKNKDFSIDTYSVIVPSNWNTPNSDAGVVQAISDLESWVSI
jgi:hypothetical protein